MRVLPVSSAADCCSRAEQWSRASAGRAPMEAMACHRTCPSAAQTPQQPLVLGMALCDSKPFVTARRGRGRRRRSVVQFSATLAEPRTSQTGSLDLDQPQMQRPRSRESRLVLGGRETEEMAMRDCIELHQRHPHGSPIASGQWEGGKLDDAYKRAGIVTAEYAKTFYLGTKLMTPEKARAVWAIYVWCRRTDELVDGPNASHITPEALDRWEDRLEALFEGRPYDVLDAALTDTVSRYPVHIQPFRDMIDGMRMDLVKSRYRTYDELYGYCYKVAGTVALMTTPVMGIDPAYPGPLEPVYRAALALGTANQLTNILRDVGEDAAERNRIYVPVDELDQFGISEAEVVSGMFAATTGLIDDRWQRFMQFQIARTRQIFAEAEAGVNLLAPDARRPVWSALILYRQILDGIEKNGYNNFTQRAYVPKWRKFLSLPRALMAARKPTTHSQASQQSPLKMS